jgi:hypothetical protein
MPGLTVCQIYPAVAVFSSTVWRTTRNNCPNTGHIRVARRAASSRMGRPGGEAGEKVHLRL